MRLASALRIELCKPVCVEGSYYMKRSRKEDKIFKHRQASDVAIRLNQYERTVTNARHTVECLSSPKWEATDERGRRRRFSRFYLIALPTRDSISQPDPTKTVVHSENGAIKFYTRAVALLGRAIDGHLLHCSHHTVTGNHRLYQSAKSWFRRCLMYCNNPFFS